jgi:hypothetical protein
MKRNLRVYLLAVVLLIFALTAIPEMYRQVFGVPSKGTGVTIKNSVVGPPPIVAWTYNITELEPSGKSAPFTITFTLQAVGGDSYSITGLKAGSYSVSEVYKFGYTADIIVTSTAYPSDINIANGYSTIITLEPSEFKTVEVTNFAMPSFSLRTLDESPPSDLSYSIPLFTPIPIQSTWNVDINGNGNIDLVAGKLTTILVNCSGVSSVSSATIIFEGSTYTEQVATNGIVAFSVVPNNITSSEDITGYYQMGGEMNSLTTTTVAVKETSDLPLYYVGLSKAEYGTESPEAFTMMMGNSSSFVKATYPVKNLLIMSTTTPIAGANKGTSRNPYSGILTDAMAAAQQAQLYMGGSAIGIAIGPNSTGTSYFTYHGFPGAAGISFGPSVKGVVVLDGYYTAPAHEIGHTFGLYYGVPEEYQVYPPQGKTASGVSSIDGTWRTGYDFMGLAPYRTTNFSWVATTTYVDIFAKTSINPADPDILLASGIVYSNGTVDTSVLPWYHLKDGIPDTLTPGDYSLDFISRSGKLLGSTSFDLQFSVDFCPGVGVGSEVDNTNFENRDTDFTGFSFATEFPKGTYKVQVMNNTNQDNPVIMTTVYESDIINERAITSDLGSAMVNDWFTLEIVLTMFANTALSATCIRLFWNLLHARLLHGKMLDIPHRV